MRWSLKREKSDPGAEEERRRPEDAAPEAPREEAAPHQRQLAATAVPAPDRAATTAAQPIGDGVAPETRGPARRLNAAALAWVRRDPAAEERRRQEAATRQTRRDQAAARRRQVAGQLAAAALSWGMNAWLEGAMWLCLAGGLLVDYIGSYADLAATFGAFGYDASIRWIMPLGIDLPVTASVVGQLLAGRWKCGWWVRFQLGVLTAALAPLTLIGNALRGAIDSDGHFTFHLELWMDLAAFAVPGLGVVLIGWIASMMQGERAELRRRQLEAEADAMAADLDTTGRDREHETDASADTDTDIWASPVPPARITAVTSNNGHDRGAPGMTGGHDRPPVVTAPLGAASGDRGQQAAMTAAPRLAVDGSSDSHVRGHIPALRAVALGIPTVIQATSTTPPRPEDLPVAGRETGHHAASSWEIDDRDRAENSAYPAMTPEEAVAATEQLVREAAGGGRPVTGADVERLTGRKRRQARRILAAAKAAVEADRTARSRVGIGPAVAAAAIPSPTARRPRALSQPVAGPATATTSEET